LLGVPVGKVNDDRLYRSLDRLLGHKEALEVHLKNRMRDLFGLEYDLILYDVTSTYFEGMADVVMPTKKGTEIRRRCVACPTKHQAILLHYLGLKLPTHLRMTEM
jgi:hypothetical protein